MTFFEKISCYISKLGKADCLQSTQPKADTPDEKFSALDSYFRLNQHTYQCGKCGKIDNARTKIIESLINQVENGALYKLDDRGICWAAKNDIPELIDYFTKKGFHLGYKNNRAMRNAILYESRNAIRALVANGVQVDDGLFKFTLRNQHYNVAKFFVDCGAHRITREYYRQHREQQ